MKRCALLVPFLLLGCNADTGPVNPAETHWGEAPAPLAVSEVRTIIDEVGFPHELPEQPRALTSPAYMPWTSGRALAFHGGALFVADTDNGDLVVIDAITNQVERRIHLGARPEQLAITPEGGVFVTVRDDGMLAYIAPESDEITSQIAVGTEPVGVALAPNAKTVYVTLLGDNQVVAYQADTLEELSRMPTVVGPRAIVATNSSWIVVAGHSSEVTRVPYDLESGAFVSDNFEKANLRQNNPSDPMLHFGRPGLTQSNRARGATLHPETGVAYVVHEQTLSGTEFDSMIASFPKEGVGHEPKESGGYGAGGKIFSDAPHLIRPMETSVTALMGGDSVEEPAWPVKGPVSSEPIVSRCAQPSDINHHPTWSLALVTGYGSDTVLVLNTRTADPMRSPVGLIDVGMAPKAVTFDNTGRYAYVLNAHSFNISRIDLTPFFQMPASDRTPSTSSLPTGVATMDPSGPAFEDEATDVSDEAEALPSMNFLMRPFSPEAVHVEPIRIAHTHVASFGVDPLPEEYRLGRRVYTFVRNDRVSQHSQFACNSCHYEGGEDGLVWFVEGGPRQTPQLAGRLFNTAPFNWMGTEQELQTNMEQTIGRMGGEGLSTEELISLEGFLLHGLPLPTNPNVAADGTLTEAQERGRNLYNDSKVACATCHAGPNTIDGKSHDVGTATELEIEIARMFDIGGSAEGDGEMPIIEYNTPSLRSLFNTAPYLHDGSAQTLHEVLERTSTTMGHTAHLTAAEKDDLVAYLLTL